MEQIRSLLVKYRKPLVYILCALATAALETAIGWCLMRAFGLKTVYANTAGMVIGAVTHYFLTLRFVFGLRNNAGSALGYIATFALGLVLQNALIYLCYDVLFASSGVLWQYLISKGVSLGLPFFITYYLRSVINARIAKKRGVKLEEDRGHATLL